jgi:hypothetical protein
MTSDALADVGITRGAQSIESEYHVAIREGKKRGFAVAAYRRVLSYGANSEVRAAIGNDRFGSQAEAWTSGPVGLL